MRSSDIAISTAEAFWCSLGAVLGLLVQRPGFAHCMAILAYIHGSKQVARRKQPALARKQPLVKAAAAAAAEAAASAAAGMAAAAAAGAAVGECILRFANYKELW